MIEIISNASDFEFTKSKSLYDVCKHINDKKPLTDSQANQKIDKTQLSSPPSQTLTRGRTHLRQNHSHTHNICARSTSRNIFCSYCHLKGNHISMCNVHLDSRGHNAFDPKEFCSFHNRTGHTLQRCCHYYYLYSSPGNDQRPSLTNPP